MNKKKPRVGLLQKLNPANAKYPPEMRPLLTTGEPKDDTPYAQWAEQLRDFVPQLIEMTLDDDLNNRPEKDRAVWAPIHALSVLAEIAPVEAVEPLLEVLEWDDDWSTDILTGFFGQVGEPAAPFLKQRALDTGRSRTIRGGAIAGLEAIAAEHPAARDDIVNFLIGYLEQGSSETPEEEYVVTSAVLALTDLKAVEALPAIERAYDEDRVETFMVALEDVKRAFGLMPEIADGDEGTQQGLALSLKCLSCGRERRYHFDRAYFDIGVVRNTPDEGAMSKAFYLPEPVVCPRCGAVEQYELGMFGHIMITAVLTSLISRQPNPIEGLRLVDFPPAPWGWLPPREALERYRAEVATRPGDITLRLDYGDTLAAVEEFDAAVEQYEQALLIDPRSGDALFGIADIKGQHGEMAEAISLWEQIERDLDKLRFEDVTDAGRESMRRVAQQALVNLRSGKRPVFEPEMARDDEEAFDPLARPLPEPLSGPAYLEPVRPDAGPYGKVGRNEPCPCGSGKKYKQCHGRK